MNETKTNKLFDDIRRRIQLAGPISVARYMDICLTDPQAGYYMTRDPLGRGGDFTTAPEISQMFGELLGLWSASVWKAMGTPDKVSLVELGPGRGTLMMDALRALRIVPDFLAAIDIHLVEISPALRDKQAKTLAKANVPLTWHRSLDTVPEGPAIILANEFFDALPIRQAIRRDDGWYERMVERDEDGALRFGQAQAPLPRFDLIVPPRLRRAKPGAIFEWRDDAAIIGLARRLRDHGGAALIIDYGHIRSDIGETFQAIAGHAYADPLEAPGEADLTAHVDFEALAKAAITMGARVYGPTTQGEFLRHLGIENRALTLMAKAQNEAANNIASGLARLIATEERAMGTLFKVMGLAAPNMSHLPALGEYAPVTEKIAATAAAMAAATDAAATPPKPEISAADDHAHAPAPGAAAPAPGESGVATSETPAPDEKAADPSP